MNRVKNPFKLSLSTFTALVGLAAHAAAQQQIEVKFAKGADNTQIEGQVTGSDYVDYIVGASEGQSMTVVIDGGPTNYFNILPPGSDGAAIFVGSTYGNETTLELPESGNFIIRVYLMGNAKSTNETVPFTLGIAID